MSDLLQKYCKVLQTVRNPSLDSTGHVGKNGSREYRYASLKACEEVVRAACKDQGIAFAYEIRSDENGWFVKTLITDGETQMWANPVRINIVGTAQEIGSWITYARRYSLCATFAIVGEEDDDAQSIQGDDAGRQPRRAQRQPQRTQTQGYDKVAKNSAVKRLNGVLQAYGNAHPGTTYESLRDGIKKRPDYAANINNPAWYLAVADEFQKELDEQPVA